MYSCIKINKVPRGPIISPAFFRFIDHAKSFTSEVFDEVGEGGPLRRVHVHVVPLSDVFLIALERTQIELTLTQELTISQLVS